MSREIVYLGRLILARCAFLSCSHVCLELRRRRRRRQARSALCAFFTLIFRYALLLQAIYSCVYAKRALRRNVYFLDLRDLFLEADCRINQCTAMHRGKYDLPKYEQISTIINGKIKLSFVRISKSSRVKERDFDRSIWTRYFPSACLPFISRIRPHRAPIKRRVDGTLLLLHR